MIGYLLVNVAATVFLFLSTAYITLSRRNSAYSYLTLAFLFELFVPFLDPPYFQLIVLPNVPLPPQYIIVYLNVLLVFAALLVAVQSVFIYRSVMEIRYPQWLFMGYAVVILFYLLEMALMALAVAQILPPLRPYEVAVIAKVAGLFFLGLTVFFPRRTERKYSLTLAGGAFLFGLSSLLKLLYLKDLGAMENIYVLETAGKILLATGLFGTQFLGRATPSELIISGAFLVTSRKLFERLLKGSKNVLLITRTKAKINNGRVFWLTRAKEGEEESVTAISPTKLGILLDIITSHIHSGYDAVFIDAVEYSIVENGPETTVRFLMDLKDRVIREKKLMVVYVDERALDEKTLHLLQREFITINQPFSGGL
ncbi:DUF835 domain-containing protein [Palaeococcus ferrophilus]|uniref:DUF835 domain-containing protein n=1 Tax=Palaeococcus ferrophilus TaxID=83868 RepID=UPI000695DCD7|nr:DUF835 domain-containing protein [Palaeococcus ferrophilus]